MQSKVNEPVIRDKKILLVRDVVEVVVIDVGNAKRAQRAAASRQKHLQHLSNQLRVLTMRA